MKKTLFYITAIFILAILSSALLGLIKFPLPPSEVYFKKGEPYEPLKLLSKNHDSEVEYKLKIIFSLCRSKDNSQTIIRSTEDLITFLRSLTYCEAFKKNPIKIDNLKFYQDKILKRSASAKSATPLERKEFHFDKKIVLANYLSVGCGTHIYKRVYIDDELKEITYKLISHSFIKPCISGRGSGGMNFIAINTPPDDYKIKFVGGQAPMDSLVRTAPQGDVSFLGFLDECDFKYQESFEKCYSMKSTTNLRKCVKNTNEYVKTCRSDLKNK